MVCGIFLSSPSKKVLVLFRQLDENKQKKSVSNLFYLFIHVPIIKKNFG
jgi:hypothetical protein